MKNGQFEIDTIKHMRRVQQLLNQCINILLDKALNHDNSKLQNPEYDDYKIIAPQLKKLTYNSPEFKEKMKEMKDAATHHYTHNRHHPEFHKNGIKDMTLMDLLEMVCDWKSASERHADGDIYKSIEICQKRFGYTDELKSIFKNTIDGILNG